MRLQNKPNVPENCRPWREPEIESFLVRGILEAFTMEPSLCCAQRNAAACLEMNARKKFVLHVLLQSTRHLTMYNLLKVPVCCAGYELIFSEPHEFLWIYHSLVRLNIQSEFWCNCRVTEKWIDFCMMALPQDRQLSFYQPFAGPTQSCLLPHLAAKPCASAACSKASRNVLPFVTTSFRWL
jgi:hypothetical protein